MVELPRPLPPPSWRDRIGELQGPPILIAIALGIAALSIGVTLVATGSLSGARQRGPDVALSLPRADASSDESAPSTTIGGDLHVHAAGAVVHPGVVTVPAGSRVTDVVAAAGGPTPEADLDQINLAAPVTDGERVYIPRRGETAVAAPSGAGGVAAAKADGLVNINDADQAALETLPGVGPSTAQAIIEYRTEHGRFRSVDDLLNVRGIGPAKLSQIKPHARV